MGTSARHQEIFVGRHAELAVLGRRIDASISHCGGVVLVAGEPGIGKTRLAEKAAEYARDQGVRVLWGRCWEGAGAPAFWPWVQIVRSLAQGMTADCSRQPPFVDEATEVAWVVPELDELLPRLGLSFVFTDSDQDRFRFFDSIAAFLTRLAAAKPLLLLVDDLHWADQGSLLLLQFLSAGIAEAPILVVGMYRDAPRRHEELISQVLGTVSRQRHSDVIALSGLQEPEVRALLTSAAGTEPSRRLLGTIMERTEGNPFFLGEVMTVLGTKDLGQSDGSELRAAVPLTVREVIGRHLRCVSTGCAALLDVASVIGREFDVELVAQAIGRPTQDLCQILDEAVSSKIVEQVRFTYYRFRHALVRETIYESLSTTARAKTHLMVAGALKQCSSAQQTSTLSMLAHHFSMSLPFGTAEQALDCTVRAAREARRRLAYEEAVAHYERALEIGGPRIEASFHCDLLLLLGEAQARAGIWLQSRRTFERAAGEARLIFSARQLAQAAIGLKGLLGSTVPVDGATVALLQEALDKLSDVDGDLQVRVLSALTNAMYFSPAGAEIENYSRRAVEIAERLGDQVLKRTAVEARVLSLFRPSHLKARLESAAQLVDPSVRADDKEMAFRGHLMRHVCFLEIGDPVESSREFEFATTLAGELRDPRCCWQVALARSAQALAMGDVVGSLDLSERAREIGEGVHGSSPAHNYVVQRFQYERIRGALQEVEGLVAAAVRQYPGVVGYRVAQAAIFAARGDTHQAHAALSLLAESKFTEIQCDALFLWTLGVLTEASVSCGEPAWWQTVYELLLPYREHNVVMSWGVAFDGAAAHFLGMLSAAVGDLDRAAEHFNAALAMNTKMGAEPLVARTQERYATFLFERQRPGDHELAGDLLRRATETMERLGQVGHLARAQQLLSRMEESRPRAVTDMSRNRVGEVCVGAGVPPCDRGEGSESPYLFRREGHFWTVAFEGSVVRLRHTRGLALLLLLLQRPETEVHVFDLMSAINGIPAVPETKSGRRSRHPLAALALDAGPVIDARARTEYRRRLQELRGELAEAERFNDLGRVSALRNEAAQLADQLQRAYGKGGGPRLTASATERARISVRNNIVHTFNTMKPSNEPLWRHMKAAVRTGTFCCYQPEHTIPWAF